MSFLARQNRQPQMSQNNNMYNTRRKLANNNQQQNQRKLSKQQLYRLQLQQQINIKKQKKRKQLQKIRQQDQKFNRQIQQIKRKQQQRIQAQKLKQIQIAQQNTSQVSVKANKKNNQKTSRVNVQQKQRNQQSLEVIQHPFQNMNQLVRYQNNLYHPFYIERQKAILMQQYQNDNQYYQQRIRKHKAQVNQKIDELFRHIHSTKQNIRADQQIQKIRRQLRSRQNYQQTLKNITRDDIYQSQMYKIPKSSQYNLNYQRNQPKNLNYQSMSKFSYNSPYQNQQQHNFNKYEYKRKIDEIGLGLDRYSGYNGDINNSPKNNKVALDMKIARTLQGIDQFHDYLRRKRQ